ncbi:unnamed protein product [Prunus armeniaca]
MGANVEGSSLLGINRAHYESDQSLRGPWMNVPPRRRPQSNFKGVGGKDSGVKNKGSRFDALRQVGENFGKDEGNSGEFFYQTGSIPVQSFLADLNIGNKVWTKSKNSIARQALEDISNKNLLVRNRVKENYQNTGVATRNTSGSRQAASVASRSTVGISDSIGRVGSQGKKSVAAGSLHEQFASWGSGQPVQKEKGLYIFGHQPPNIGEMATSRGDNSGSNSDDEVLIPSDSEGLDPTEKMDFSKGHVSSHGGHLASNTFTPGEGAASSKFKSNVLDLICTHRLDMLFLCDPRISGAKAISVVKSLGFPCFEIVDAVGPNAVKRVKMWDYLSFVAASHNMPWLIAGDFNELLTADEKFGGVLECKSKVFRNWVDGNEMIDLSYSGPKFTWNNKRVYTRLDRAICNMQWRRLFPEANVQHLPRTTSDHNPIKIKLSSRFVVSPHLRPFRFEAMWMQHEQFNEFISDVWGQAAASALDKTYQLGSNTFLSKLEISSIEEYNCVLEQEAMIWKQKSRLQWLREGDRNTKFFHLTAIIRRRRNKIERLKNNEGVWVEEAQYIKGLAMAYFEQLFSQEIVEHRDLTLPMLFPVIDLADLVLLEKNVDMAEIKRSLFGIGGLKAPGIDGLPACFYQAQWNNCSDDIFALVTQAFQKCSIPDKLNYTLITLVPKVQSPQSMVQFRPISLCSTLVQDNILIAQELMHKFKLSKGKKGFVAWKIDLSKAYGRLSWHFVEYVLLELRLPTPFVKLIMNCVQSVRYQINVNKELTAPFSPMNGIRQGDPLSPYLFVLCIEKLSHIICDAVSKKKWRPMKSSQSGPAISHLFFADDLVLFVEASANQAKIMKSCLDLFCSASGQVVMRIGKRTYSSLVDKGNSEKKYKIHLCQWDLACRPKGKGGLGFKKTASMNQALLAKIGWRLHSKDNGLWAKIYEAKQQAGVLTIHDSNCFVLSFSKNGWWDIDKLRGVLCEDLVQQVISVLVGFLGSLPDTQIWKGSANGNFFVKSTYSLFFEGCSTPDSCWKSLWILNVPPKLQYLMWLASQGKILSNDQRVRRYLASDPSCGFCSWPTETVLHILRDCERARSKWNAILPDYAHHFFHLDAQPWMKVNVLSREKWNGDVPWSTVFVFTCWHLWCWRNKHVFQNEDAVLFSPRQVICGAAQEWIKSTSNRTVRVNKVQINVAWEPPGSGQFKLNVDGSRRSVTGCIGAGGVIRDPFGGWVSGFAINLGKGQVLEAEIWGLFFGLKLAIEKGISSLIIEMDSAIAVNLCQNSSMLTLHPLAALVRNCCDLKQQVPRCALQHVFHEKNIVADRLAN